MPFAISRRALLASPLAMGSPLTPRRLFADVPSGHLGAPSPDGRWLSGVDAASGDLLLRDLASGATRRLTANPTGSGQFAYFSVFSRDSRRIAYAWFHGEGFYDLRLIGADGSGPRVLHRNPERRFVQPCAFSADGRSLLTLFFRNDNVSQIALVSTADGSVRILQSLDWIYPNRMDLSPDGRWIAYDAPIEEGGNRRTVYLLATDGSARRRPIAGPEHDTFPLFTTAGDAVLFLRDNRLFRQSLAGGAPVPLADGLTHALPLGITGRGDYLYAVRENGYRIEIATAEEAAKPRTISGSLPVVNAPPDFSPDGSRIAFLARAANENFGQDSRVIAVREIDSGRGQLLAPHLAHIDRVLWDRDGRNLLVSGSDRHGQRGLYRIDGSNGAVTPLVREPASTYEGFPVAVGAEGVFYAAAGAIRSLDPERVLVPLRPGVRVRWLTAGGGKLAYVLREGESESVHVASIATGEPRQAASGKGIAGLAFLSDALLATGAVSLLRIPLASGAPQRVPWKLGHRGPVAADRAGKRIAWVAGSAQTSLWVLERIANAAHHQRPLRGLDV